MGRFLQIEVIKLQLVPFSLRDVAGTWFESLPYGSVNNWEELVEADMSRFFPHALTLKKRGEIIVFKQGDDESLYIAWEKFKRLLKRYPMHDIDLTTQMDIFHHSMNYTSKGIIDVALSGAHTPVPDSTWSTNRIRDAVFSFMNPKTIHFLNKTHFKYLFVNDNYPYENIYIYITLT